MESFFKKFDSNTFCTFFSIILSLYCGIFDDVSRYLSVSRTLVFLPYFLAGYFCSEEMIVKIKKMPKKIGFSVLLLALCVVLYLFELNILPSEILKGADSYNKLGLSILNGFFSRIILLFIATSCIVSLINLIPEKQFKITYIGKRTLVIYLLHPFFILMVGKFCKTVPLFNEYYGIIVCLFIAIAITGLLSVSLLSQFYGYLSSWISKIFRQEYLDKNAI